MIIVHLSDLHFGMPEYVEKLGENVSKKIEQIKPELLIITGDITDCGYLEDYEEAKKFIDLLKSEKKLIVPGNHDARNAGYLLFEEFFKTRYPVMKIGNLKIVGVDSSEPDIDDGHIGRSTYNFVRRELKGVPLKMVVLHHHLIPVPNTGRERNIPVDAGDFLKLIGELHVNLVLWGHKHVPWFWKLNGTLMVHAGTATTRRTKARIEPSFNVINLNETSTKIIIKQISSKTLKEKIIYKGMLK